MAKKECCICNKELGLLSAKTALSDGFVCGDCLKKAGISILTNARSYTCSSAKALIKRRIPIIESFRATKKIGLYLSVDENHESFKINNDIFQYSNLLSFELLEDGETITKGGIGRAVAGGILFGGVGAVVGAVTGGKKSKTVCKSMKLRITLKDAHTDTVYIPFITTETKTNGILYKTSQQSAQSCISALEIITDKNNHVQPIKGADQVPAPNSNVDELLKFKQLLDAGVITQEEFDAKKKQLLGL